MLMGSFVGLLLTSSMVLEVVLLASAPVLGLVPSVGALQSSWRDHQCHGAPLRSEPLHATHPEALAFGVGRDRHDETNCGDESNDTDGDEDRLEKRGKLPPPVSALDASLRQIVRNAMPSTPSHEAASQSSRGVYLLLDANNIRGSDDFRWTLSELIHNLIHWSTQELMMPERKARAQYILVHPVLVVDHGSRMQAFDYSCDGLAVLCAGPHQTADDLIVHTTEWLLNGSAEQPADLLAHQQSSEPHGVKGNPSRSSKKSVVLVVTSDGELRSRCRNHGASKVYGSPQMVRLLKEWKRVQVERQKMSNGGSGTAGRAGVFHQSGVSVQLGCGLQLLRFVEDDVREHEIYVMQQSRGANPRHSNLRNSSLFQTTIATDTTAPITTVGAIASLPSPPLSPSPLSPSPSSHEHNLAAFAEESWYRIVAAESLRRLLHLHQGDSPMRTIAQLNESSYGSTVMSKLCHAINDQSYDEASGAGFHRSDSSSITSLCQDHRINEDVHQQRQMAQYFTQCLASHDHASDGGKSAMNPLVAERAPARMDQAKALLRKYVEQTPHKTQDEILARYCNESPSQVQFTRKHDLKTLLLEEVAVREKRKGNKRRRWYLLPLGDGEIDGDVTADESSTDESGKVWGDDQGTYQAQLVNERRKFRRRRSPNRVKKPPVTERGKFLEQSGQIESRWFAALDESSAQVQQQRAKSFINRDATISYPLPFCCCFALSASGLVWYNTKAAFVLVCY